MARSAAAFASALLYVAVLFAALSGCVSARVVGIDYGTDWLKAALIKPGGMLETVLNRESKRKTAAVVNIRDGIRSFGSDAISLGMRFPKTTFAGLKNIMGKQYTDTHSTEFRTVFQNEMVQDRTRKSVAFSIGDKENTVLQVEELAAMLFAYVKRMSEEYGGVDVSGAVITVPPYFSQFERQAILDAAEIADLRVLSLINDETAVAINYALGKRFPEPTNIVFYDMGAGSTIASLITFKTDTVKKSISSTPRTVLDISVKAVAADETLGGHWVDVRLRDYLAQKFMEINKGSLKGVSIFDDARAMTRLLKEANRVKLILSANQDTFSSVESLVDGIDFRLKVTRQDLEDICKDLFARVAKPVDDVLEASGLTLTDIDAVVLVGGGVRIPAIQAALSKAVGESKIARNVDGDEAAVHGAVYHAASISAQFRLGLDIKIRDLVPTPIQIAYTSSSSDGSAPQLIKTSLYNKTDSVGSKKLMNFRQNADFEFDASYHKDDKDVAIAKVKVTGLTEAIEKYKAKPGADADTPKVKVLFEMSDSGVLSVSKAYALFTIHPDNKPSSLADKVLSFFSSKGDGSVSDGSEDDKKEDDSGDVTAADSSETVKKNSTSKGKSDNSTEEAEKKPVVERVALSVAVAWQTLPPLSTQTKNAARRRLSKMDAEDRARENRAAAINKLESFLYRCKELLWDDDAASFLTSEELESFKADVEKQSDWLEENSEAADDSEFDKRHAALSDSYSRFVIRRTEAAARPAAVAEHREAIKKATTLHELLKAAKGTDGEALYTSSELEMLSAAIEADDKWLSESVSKQDALQKNVDPILLSDDIQARLRKLQKLLSDLDLQQRMKISAAKAKASKTTSKTTTSESAPSAAESTSSSDSDGRDEL